MLLCYIIIIVNIINIPMKMMEILMMTTTIIIVITEQQYCGHRHHYNHESSSLTSSSSSSSLATTMNQSTCLLNANFGRVLYWEKSCHSEQKTTERNWSRGGWETGDRRGVGGRGSSLNLAGPTRENSKEGDVFPFTRCIPKEAAAPVNSPHRSSVQSLNSAGVGVKRPKRKQDKTNPNPKSDSAI